MVTASFIIGELVNGLKIREVSGVLLLAVCAWFIHGYHPTSKTPRFTCPESKRSCNPGYSAPCRIFPVACASDAVPEPHRSLRALDHLPFDVALLLWHLASIFLFLISCYGLSSRCFTAPQARWAGVALVAALLTLPVAGTSLYILDQYLNPRNLRLSRPFLRLRG